ncbi:STAS/SEC14 domain-containing protein [Leucothrix pacifica]|uniref:STAS/SEC14 domain-containing protein n=1 Tax=Leucothrix pacifica TaxID=1247513 RepID=A0A317CHM1_9GAMM|nr:STAS/SEC14 domain-containing protein [Leucothrix pacifica]PWQ98054.1 hypothetical protein DKW60_08930 [Leucothrix pacifica]
MFTVTPNGDNRVDIELNGDIDADIMRQALDDLAEHSANISGGKMLYTVKDFHWPSLGAIGVEFSRLPSLFSLAFKFKKAAVVTDEKWIKTVSGFKGVVIPGMEIKAFSLDQVAEAEAWLAQEKIENA